MTETISVGSLAGLLPAVERAAATARAQILGVPDGAPGARILGVPDGAKAAVIAALAQSGAAPVLVVTARHNRAFALHEDIRAWLPTTESRPILTFPPREALPYERRGRDSETVHARLRVLAAIAGGARPLIVADAQALSQRTLAPGALLPTLRGGDSLPRAAFLAALDRAGYRAQAVVDEPGTFALRGGIIDLFPPTAAAPLRLELVGDTIESLREFDPVSQRSTQTLDAAPLSAAAEAQVDADAVAWARSLTSDSLRPEVATAFATDLTQIEMGALPAQIGFWTPFLARGALWEHLPAETLVIWDESDEIRALLGEISRESARARRELEQRGEIPGGLPLPHLSPEETIDGLERFPASIHLHRFATDDPTARSARLPFAPVEAYGSRLPALIAELRRAAAEAQRTVVVSLQAPRLTSLFVEHGLAVTGAQALTDEPTPGIITLLHGTAPHGWRLRADGARPVNTVLLTDTEIFGFAKQRRATPRSLPRHESFLDDLQPGDFVVHIEHGIARFLGAKRERIGDREREYLELAYAENDRLLVPTDQLHRLQRYIGASDSPPVLTRLGTQQWHRAKQRARAAVRELAEELIALYASRQVLPGVAFPPDGLWQLELEAAFPYVETPDQAEAIQEVKADMEAPHPMDRIVLGDVGYGKTEVAVRAAFKAATGGYQVALLVPTTVLAQQHAETFAARLAAFPVRVEMLSRFRSDAEQRAIIADLTAGRIDIVIGTHRLLQKDVQFQSLGLVIIDEEQRFGVAHKETLKQMRREVDVLTLSATPIPRTLHMALAGIRDMSTIATPPEARLPIVTYVLETDDQVVRDAVLREIERGGQVYFVHNRVQSIDMTARWLRALVPEATFVVGHGQMPEDELAHVMAEFSHARADVLVCTTIIESGLDIPNVNTIIMHQAQRLGLAQLYQLRGRVGRGAERAYAYLLYDRRQPLSEIAQKRLQTIFEATELGAGFQIALRDLEIRGAGNLLGAEQSGPIGAVGFELYTQMLAEAVEQLRAQQEGRPPLTLHRGPTVSMDLPLVAHLPDTYITDTNVRLAIYQRLAAVDDPDAVTAIATDLQDRFGPPPPPAQSLLAAVHLRALAARLGSDSLAREEEAIILRLTRGLTFPLAAYDVPLPDGVKLGRTILTLDLRRVGDRWIEVLQAAMIALGAAVPPPTVAAPR